MKQAWEQYGTACLVLVGALVGGVLAGVVHNAGGLVLGPAGALIALVWAERSPKRVGALTILYVILFGFAASILVGDWVADWLTTSYEDRLLQTYLLLRHAHLA